MKKAILLLAMIIAFVSCEKEPCEFPPDPIEVLGIWDLHHDVNGVSTPDFIINGDTWNYTLTIHNLVQGEMHSKRNGLFYRTYKFHLNVQDDSMHFSYWTGMDPGPMGPASGWNMWMQWDNVLLIEYQSWIKR